MSDLESYYFIVLNVSLDYMVLPIDISTTSCYRENLPNRATFLYEIQVRLLIMNLFIFFIWEVSY